MKTSRSFALALALALAACASTSPRTTDARGEVEQQVDKLLPPSDKADAILLFQHIQVRPPPLLLVFFLHFINKLTFSPPYTGLERFVTLLLHPPGPDQLNQPIDFLLFLQKRNNPKWFLYCRCMLSGNVQQWSCYVSNQNTLSVIIIIFSSRLTAAVGDGGDGGDGGRLDGGGGVDAVLSLLLE